MKTATVRDLRNDFRSLEAWLAEGETIQIEKRGTPVALLTPLDSSAAPEDTSARPDVRARRKAIWGDRCFTAEEVKAMREYELEGEEG
jgi:antitoxin (DNA-binding transcriptional repressor) of toxin-antitoxin stability system